MRQDLAAVVRRIRQDGADTDGAAPGRLDLDDGPRRDQPGVFRSWQDECHALASMRLPSMKRAPSLARRFVRQHLCATHAFGACSASELLLSEIVTLAVFDGEGPVDVSFGCRASAVVLGVACASSPETPWFDGRRNLLPLMIARSIARQWGTSSDVAGDTLWHLVPTGYLD